MTAPDPTELGESLIDPHNDQSQAAEAPEDGEATTNVIGDGTSLDPASSGRTPFWGKMRDGFGNASSRATSAGAAFASKAVSLGAQGVTKTAEVSKQTYLAAGSTIGAAVSYVDTELEERGAKQVVRSTAGAVIGKIDEVTGKRLVELLEIRLQKQDTYNDVLASRLADALGRIAVLEKQIEQLTHGVKLESAVSAEDQYEHR